MSKQIRLFFTDFPPGFQPQNFFLWRLLARHYDLVLDAEHPDYLFYSVFGTERFRFDDHAVKIFWTGENQTPDFNFCDYAIAFDYLTFGDRYFRYPLAFNSASCERVLALPRYTDREAARRLWTAKEGFCSFVYSNNNASPERAEIFSLLNGYKPVASGGRYANNVGGPVADKIEFQHRHKFCIAFENTSTPGYVTEKLMNAFESDAIPIYWGDPTVAEVFNPRSFINCHAFASFDEVLAEVRRLDADDEACLDMLQQPPILDMEAYVRRQESALESFLCHIFDPELPAAYRCNRLYWGQKQLAERRRLLRAYDRSLAGLLRRAYVRCLYPFMRYGNHLWLYRFSQWLRKRM